MKSTFMLSDHFRTARSLAKSVRLMEKHTYIIAAEQIPNAKTYARRFLLGYTWLAFNAYVAGKHRFKLRPKFLCCSC